MNKNMSLMLIAAVFGIMIAGTIVVTVTTLAFADVRGSNTNPVASGRAVINTIEHSSGYNHQSANGGNACNNRCGANSD